MTREELLARARRELWAAWMLSADEIGSVAAGTLANLGMLVEPGGAAELEQLRARPAGWESVALGRMREERDALRARVAKLEAALGGAADQVAELESELGGATARVAELEAQRKVLAERLRAGQRWQQGRNPELVSENLVSQSELRNIFDIPLVAPWADGITQQIVPLQALREQADRETESHDLPETGGTQ